MMTFFDAFFSVVARELRRMRSNPVYLTASVGVMLFCFIFFVSIFEDGQPQDMPIAVVDQDQSALSRQFLRNLDAGPLAEIAFRPSDYSEARALMQQGKIYAFVVVQPNFSSDVLANRRPEITFYVNDAYLVAGSLLLKEITYMVELTGGAIKQNVLMAKGMESHRTMGLIQPIQVDMHLIGNPWAHYGVYLLNLLLPGVLQLSILLLTVYALGIELKEKTAPDWLRLSPNSFLTALIGKLFPYTILFTCLSVLTSFVLYRYQQFPLQVSFGWMLLTGFVYVLAYQALGVLIIGITPVLRDSVTLSALYGLLGFTFAGFTFPIEQLPYPARIFSLFFPIRHYFNLYVPFALNGLSVPHITASFVSLFAFLLLPMVVYARLKKAATQLNFPIK